MKKCICLVILFLTIISAMAQNNKELKNIKLKSGINLSGYVTNNDDGSISVTTIDGDQLWYTPSEIESIKDDPSVVEARRKAEAEAKAKAQEEAELAIAREKAEAKAAKQAKKEAIQMKEKGFQLLYEIGVYKGPEGLLESISLIPSYRFNSHFLVGLGIGAFYNEWYCDDYYYWYASGTAGSISVRAIYNFKEKRVTPYIGLIYAYNYFPQLFINNHQWHHEKAIDIDSYQLGGDFGWMFRTRRGRGLNMALSVNYLPAPSSIHGVELHDGLCVGGKIGLIF